MSPIFSFESPGAPPDLHSFPTRRSSDLWATKVAGLSTSLMVSVPAVEISAARLVSVRFFVSAERTAASLVPRMLMVTEVSVPSALARSEERRVGEEGGDGVGGEVGV